METYSLYIYYCGTLNIFGCKSERSKHATIEDAVKEYTKYVEHMTRINKGKPALVDKQVLIVRYDNEYQSEIVGIIKNGTVYPIVAPF